MQRLGPDPSFFAAGFLAVGAQVLGWHAPRFPEGTPTRYRGAGAPITALAASRTHVYAGTAEGHVWRWTIGDPERPEAELPRRVRVVARELARLLAGRQVLDHGVTSLPAAYRAGAGHPTGTRSRSARIRSLRRASRSMGSRC